TLKSTSSRALKGARAATGCPRKRATASSAVCFKLRSCPSWNSLLTWLTSMIAIVYRQGPQARSNNVGEMRFGALEDEITDGQGDAHQDRSGEHRVKVGRSTAQNHVLKTLDDPSQRIEGVHGVQHVRPVARGSVKQELVLDQV